MRTPDDTVSLDVQLVTIVATSFGPVDCAAEQGFPLWRSDPQCLQ
jgi:hypothetical protein